MSTESIREAAEREAEPDEAEPDEAEAEQDAEAERAAEAEQAPEPEPEPSSDAVIEATYKSIETKASNYGRDQLRLLEQTGAPWQTCPCCQVPGFVLPANPLAPEDQERLAATVAYFGADEPPYLDAPDKKECEGCAGLGFVKSGAKVEANRIVPCSTCNGNGFVPIMAQPATVYGSGAATNGEGQQPGAPNAATFDLWGREQGHSDYGVPPALINASQ